MKDLTPAAQTARRSSFVPVNQPLLFQRLRWRLLYHSLEVTFQRAAVRLVSIVLCSLLVWGGVFVLSMGGFWLLRYQHLPLLGGIVSFLFDFLFLALLVLLVFSTGLILYSSLFSSPEARFLLITPAAADQVFAFKFQGAVAFSSWAFLLLGSPILIAYGLVAGVPWYFYVLLPLYFLGFVLFPGSLGALICLLLVNGAPRRPRQLLLAVGLLVLLGCGLWGYLVAQNAWSGAVNRELLQKLVSQVAFAQAPLVPSHWMTRGLVAAARRDLAGALYHLALVWANGLFLYVGITWAASRLYRRGYDRVATGGLMRRRYGGAWLDRTLTGMVGFLDPQTRLLIVKDFRTFRRDPAQWAQVLIFTLLLSLYFANIRRLYLENISWNYQNGISLLNLISTAFLLCAYTGRFIYPMLSLEGRQFWILGLLPLQRERLLWGKFAFSATGGLVIAEFLIVFSDVMLGVPWWIVVLHVLTVAVLALGLSGLSVGLGACMPNFQESDPSKIAVGFGGTLNLVAGLIFLLVTIGLMAVPWHLHAAGSETPVLEGGVSLWLLGIGVLAGLGCGVAAVVVPLSLGAEALRRMEF